MVSKNVIAILGDIGGTNSRLQLVDIDLNSREPKVLYFPEPKHSSSFKSFIDCVAEFLKSAPQEFQPKIACLGIAGPVVDNETTVTNLHWPKVSGSEIKEAFNLEDVYLYNDFEIAACYVENVSEENTFLLNAKTAKTPKNKLKTVVGPGTGLGYCHLIPLTSGDKVDYHIFGTEGGHADFPPITEEQMDYTKYLMETHSLTQVCLERAFAGQAIQDMYNFYKKRLQAETVIENDHTDLLNRNIIKYGIARKDKHCEAVVNLLTQLLAQEIGNLALRTLAYSGVYIIGSIINSLKEYILEDPENHFFKHYFNKSSNKHFEKLNEIPIYIVTFVECGLYGAFFMAQKCLRKKL